MEWDQLVAALQRHGIDFLTSEGQVLSSNLSPEDLIRELTIHPHPRLHLALTSLFLLHPEYHKHVPGVISRLDGAAKIELQARYLAAVYLQRMWLTRLGYCLGEFELLLDYFSSELGLPSPSEGFGKTGLLATAEWHAKQSEYPYNRLASYEKSLELLIGQLRAEARQHEFAAAGYA